MKKLENFSNCLNVLKNADFDLADNNDIYRTGVIGQFNLTIELAWKALQEIEYSYAAEPPVQFRLSHLSRRSEPL